MLHSWVAIILGFFVVIPAIAQQQTTSAYPNKLVRLIVGYAPGAATDLIARSIAQKLSERWGVQVAVDNRVGANTIIATEYVAKAAPDGYTLLLANSANATNPSVYTTVPYDPVKDFTSIGMAAIAINLISANPAFPPNNLNELIAFTKVHPGKVTFGTPGAGSSQHLIIEMLCLRTGMKLNHVPYKGGAPAIVDTIGGQISMMIGTIASQDQYVKSGKLKALMVTSAQRSLALPNIPTIAEQGYPDLQSDYWLGIMGPGGLPRGIVEKINADVTAVLNLAEVRERFAGLGIEPIGGTPEALDKYYKDELTMWARVVHDGKLERMKR